MKDIKRCKHEGCNGIHHAKGLCSKHYQRVRKHVGNIKMYNREEVISISVVATIKMEKREAKRLKALSKRMRPSKFSKIKGRLSSMIKDRGSINKSNDLSVSFATGNGVALAHR